MKIIDNKKDYYDYLSGVYGIDNLIIYDRRGSLTISSEKAHIMGMDYYFDQRVLPLDKCISNKQLWNLKSIVRYREAEAQKQPWNYLWEEGDIYHFILEVGNRHYRFEVERWVDDKKQDLIHVEYTLLDTIEDVKKRYSEAPMCIIPCHVKFWRWKHEEQWKEASNTITRRVDNPILAGTFIPKMIPATDIWQTLYDYLSSLKDKPITDTRTDIQKLESAGFDKKTSFRKVK